MIGWRSLLLMLGVSTFAGAFIDAGAWENVKQGVLVSLSVVAAGVLVRLARGLPFVSADQYELDEIRQLTRAFGQIMRLLKALFVVVVIEMIAVVIIGPLFNLLASKVGGTTAVLWSGRAVSGLLGFLLAYIFLRMFRVVQGDEDLAKVQSQFVVRSVERRQAKAFEHQGIAQAEPFKTPSNYGRLIQ